MGRHEDSIPPNPTLYPEELQLKLYQAFIFSIPILFSIILFLLFYLFYLKRRANHMSSQSSTLQRSGPNQAVSFLSPPWNLGLKGDLKDKLHVVLFDEELRERDSLCCVCLGEFEMKEELRQLPLCKHLFHWDCIRHWLRTNATCPLCRCPLISAIKTGQRIGLNPTRQGSENATQQQQEQRNMGSSSSNSNSNNSSRSEAHVIQIVRQDPSSSISSNTS